MQSRDKERKDHSWEHRVHDLYILPIAAAEVQTRIWSFALTQKKGRSLAQKQRS